MKKVLTLSILFCSLISSTHTKTNKKIRKRKRAAYEYVQSNINIRTTRENDVKIRVLLGDLSRGKKNWKLRVESEKGFLVYDQKKPGKKILIRDTALSLSVKNNKLLIQNDKSQPKVLLSNNVVFKPIGEYTVLNGTPYNGTININFENVVKTPLVINHVCLDDYIYSVLRYETYQSWPHEMHKVQAVVSRTYALHHIVNSRNRNKLYDLKNSPMFHQNYRGVHPYKHLRKAVDATKDMIISYNNKPALAMFDICCGGAVPAHIAGPRFSEAPYLARTKPCTFCKDYKLYSWQQEVNFNQFMKDLNSSKRLKDKVSNIGSIKNIRVTSRDRAGLVKRVQLQGAIKNIICSGKALLQSMGTRLKSLSFNVKNVNKSKTRNIVFTGKGYGHQMGLCQRGAHALVNKGWHFKEILSFYYPKTTLGLVESVTKKE